jgi:signal transduction histidine kinase
LTTLSAAVCACSGAALAVAGGVAPTRTGAVLDGALILAVGLASLVDRDRRRQRQTEHIIRLMRRVRLETGLGGTIEALAKELVDVFQAHRILIAAEEASTGRSFLWSARRAAPGPELTFRQSVLGVTDRETYFFDAPGSWRAVRSHRHGRERVRAVAIDERADGVRRMEPYFIPMRFKAAHDCASYLAASFSLADDWTSRVYVLDAGVRMSAAEQLRLVRDLVNELGPAVHNVFLLHRLQTRAAEIERANLARGLHDGLIQSLIGAEMRVHVARRHAGEELPRVDRELSHIEEILHQEVLNVRDLMQRIKPIRIDPDELPEFLTDEVDRFERDTGIAARFLADAARVTLSPYTCAQIARIVQEALCNVRKHSGARSVDVRLSAHAKHWSLIVEDDGRGIRQRGPTDAVAERGPGSKTPRLPSPAVIRECVRSIGGDLKVALAASGGLRLEITIPGPTEAGLAAHEPAGHAPYDLPVVAPKAKTARSMPGGRPPASAARSGSRGFMPRVG